MRLRAFLVVLLLAPAALAVEPNEILDDPELEARARVISKELRCLVCRNESIDDSNANLARDLRLLVRERLVAGDSDEQTIAYIVDRYGEYVLLRPSAKGQNLILWFAGPVILLIGLGLVVVMIRRKSTDAPVTALSDEEQARLDRILGDDATR